MKCYFLRVQASLLPGASSRDMAVTCSAQEHMHKDACDGKNWEDFKFPSVWRWMNAMWHHIQWIKTWQSKGTHQAPCTDFKTILLTACCKSQNYGVGFTLVT